MDMTCLTGTLGASDNLPVLSTCFLTTIFSKSNAARYLRSAVYFKKITVHLLKQLNNLTVYDLLGILFYHYNTKERNREVSKDLC